MFYQPIKKQEKMKNYYVIEDRGSDISYPVFCSTQEGCEQWVKENTIGHPLNDEIRISPDGQTNGNGEFFTYVVEAVIALKA